jgi:GNAT superfamily N-acetyltransferase
VTEIVRGGQADAATAARVIADAFQDLAACRWLVSNPEERHPVLVADFRILVDYVLDAGELHLTGDRDGVALWLPRDAGPLPEPPNYEARLRAACGPYTERFHILDETFEKHHPHDPHHYLAILAVRPERQGQGLGSALLSAYHARLDESGTAAFLEASSERSRDLYLRHGYERLGDPYYLPDGPPFWPMWRNPR